MNDIFKYGFFILIAVVIGILIFQGQSDGDKLYENELKDHIKAQDEIISRLEDENSQISVDLSLKADSIAVLSVDVQKIDNKRKAAIRYYENRIKNIDNLSIPELDSLFKSRYGQ